MALSGLADQAAGSPLCRINASNQHRLSRARRGNGRHHWRHYWLPDRSFDWGPVNRAMTVIEEEVVCMEQSSPLGEGTLFHTEIASSLDD